MKTVFTPSIDTLHLCAPQVKGVVRRNYADSEIVTRAATMIGRRWRTRQKAHDAKLPYAFFKARAFALHARSSLAPPRLAARPRWRVTW